MVEDSDKNSSCTGKIRHASYAAAHKHTQRGKRTSKGMSKTMKIGIYLCSFCLFWHIGHSHKRGK